jgi:PKD repeat protein
MGDQMGNLKKESLESRDSAACLVRALCIALATAIIVAWFPLLSEGAPPSSSMTLDLSPSYIYAGLPAKIRAVATLASDPGLAPSSVSLYYIDDNGKQTFIDYLYDDGTHGDAIANDNIFSNVLISSETQPRTIKYQVSAYYGGVQRSSPIVYLVVKASTNLEGLWAGFVDRMVKRDLNGALLYFREERRAKYRASYEKVGIDKLSAAYQSARNLSCYRIYMGEAEFNFTITINNRDYIGTMIFYLEPDGAWRINTLDFE